MKNDQNQKVPLSTFFVFGLSQFVYMSIMNFVTAEINIYSTDILLIPVAIMGTVTILGKILEVVTAPFTGLMIEKIKMPWGKYRSWLMIACIPFALFHAGIFSVASFKLPLAGSVALFGGFLYLASLSGNITQSVQSSLVQGITYHNEDRKKLVTVNACGNYLAKSATGFMTFNLVAFFALYTGGENTGMALALFVLALAAILVYYILAHVVKRFKVDEDTEEHDYTARETLKLTFSNKYLLYVFGAFFMKSGAYFVVIGSTSYYFKYVVQQASMQRLFMTTINFAALAGVLLARYIFKNFSNKKAYLVCLVTMGVAAFASRFSGSNGYLFIGIMCLFAFVDSIVGIYSHLLFAESVDYCEYKNRVSFRGLSMSLHTLALDSSRIIQQIVVTIGLLSINYSASVGIEPENYSALLNMICLVPLIFLGLSLFFLTRYKLSPETMSEVRAELVRRRESKASA